MTTIRTLGAATAAAALLLTAGTAFAGGGGGYGGDGKGGYFGKVELEVKVESDAKSWIVAEPNDGQKSEQSEADGKIKIELFTWGHPAPGSAKGSYRASAETDNTEESEDETSVDSAQSLSEAPSNPSEVSDTHSEDRDTEAKASGRASVTW